MIDPGDTPGAPTANLAISHAGSTVVAAVSGEIDMHTAPLLDDALGDTVQNDGDGSLVLDLTGVTFLSSAGLTWLLAVADAAEAAGRRLRLVVGDSRMVRMPLKITNLDTRLDLYSTLDDALAGRDRV